jgi:hypothetical protein
MLYYLSLYCCSLYWYRISIVAVMEHLYRKSKCKMLLEHCYYASSCSPQSSHITLARIRQNNVPNRVRALSSDWLRNQSHSSFASRISLYSIVVADPAIDFNCIQYWAFICRYAFVKEIISNMQCFFKCTRNRRCFGFYYEADKDLPLLKAMPLSPARTISCLTFILGGE